MKLLKEIDWSTVTIIGSVIIGWLLNQVGSYLNNRKSDRSLKKTVLFNLLEVDHILNQLDNEESLALINSKISEGIKDEENTNAFQEEISEFHQTTTKSFLEKHIFSKLDDIKQNFNDAIENLAAIKPLTAFSLSGKANYIEILSSFESFLDRALDKHTRSKEEKDQLLKWLKQTILSDAFSKIHSDIKRDIRSLAFSISIWTWISVVISQKTKRNRQEAELNKKLETLIQSLEMEQSQ
jgi:hypothetical protein